MWQRRITSSAGQMLKCLNREGQGMTRQLKKLVFIWKELNASTETGEPTVYQQSEVVACLHVALWVSIVT